MQPAQEVRTRNQITASADLQSIARGWEVLNTKYPPHLH